MDFVARKLAPPAERILQMIVHVLIAVATGAEPPYPEIDESEEPRDLEELPGHDSDDAIGQASAPSAPSAQEGKK
ncbi:hypothetical protein CDES_10640 [Corynebacterium deserti GIMN1.010]|uniref:Uncharacterized protein n=1 Tax=Corynebacterium deserti GIMN1.010 TaxID=931089 RepID=A0A0M3QA13_9CORY|nr:hypothetical protein CDES_10640 [Corynebacterium deserti GIMN1.010]